LQDVTFNLLFAGHDTTAATLTLMLRYLKQEPTVLQKLCDEQKQVSCWNMQNSKIVINAFSYDSLSGMSPQAEYKISSCTRLIRQDRQFGKISRSTSSPMPSVQARHLHSDSLSPLHIKITNSVFSIASETSCSACKPCKHSKS